MSLKVKRSLFFSLILISTVFILYSCSNDEITSYPLIQVNGRWIAGTRAVYKILPESQKVVYSYPIHDGEPQRMDNCAIINKNNWRCTYSDNSGSVGCRNGKFYEEPPSKNVKFVSCFEWWFVRLNSHYQDFIQKIADAFSRSNPGKSS